MCYIQLKKVKQKDVTGREDTISLPDALCAPFSGTCVAEELVGTGVVGCARRRWCSTGWAATASHCRVRLDGEEKAELVGADVAGPRWRMTGPAEAFRTMAR